MKAWKQPPARSPKDAPSITDGFTRKSPFCRDILARQDALGLTR